MRPEAADALLVVPFTYDYPEWSAVSLLEASRVFLEDVFVLRFRVLVAHSSAKSSPLRSKSLTIGRKTDRTFSVD